MQSVILNCNSKKVVYLLKCRICGEAPFVGKAKMKFRGRFNNYKTGHRSYRKKRKVSQQRFYEHYGRHSHNGIDDWQFKTIQKFETHEQLKEGNHFGNTGLKRFTLMGLMKRENIYIKSSFLTFPLIRRTIFYSFLLLLLLLFLF